MEEGRRGEGLIEEGRIGGGKLRRGGGEGRRGEGRGGA